MFDAGTLVKSKNKNKIKNNREKSVDPRHVYKMKYYYYFCGGTLDTGKRKTDATIIRNCMCIISKHKFLYSFSTCTSKSNKSNKSSGTNFILTAGLLKTTK